MTIYSALNKKEYLDQMRQRMDSLLNMGDERYTGIIVGSFFWVTYHSGYEWNRKITNEKNRAFGFVHDDSTGCCVRCVCTKGYLDPFAMIPLFTFLLILTSLVGSLTMLDNGGDFRDEFLAFTLGFSAVYTLIFAVASFIQVSMTERGCQGKSYLMALLHHPEDPYNHIYDYYY